MNPRGSVVSLHVAPTGAAPIQNRDRVEAIAGRGLEGDRYFAGIGTYSHVPGSGRHVTLIEIEAIEGLKHDYDIDVAPGKSRRNIVTRGVALNHLVEREFLIGRVRLRGTRLCEPCATPGAIDGTRRVAWFGPSRRAACGNSQRRYDSRRRPDYAAG